MNSLPKVWALCPDCGVEEGKLHLDNCDQERCSKCGAQVLSKGRCENAESEPFFSIIGFHCERCDEYFPHIFIVSDEDWKRVCGGTYPLSCVLCKSCYDFIMRIRNKC
jgi:hypothetical protein